jgi:hypothetical protein
MALNDDIDLAPVDNSLLELPGLGSKNISNPNKLVTKDDNPQVIFSVFPNAGKSFDELSAQTQKAIRDNITGVEILGSETVNKPIANYTESAFPGLFQKVAYESFTTRSTKLNLKELHSHVRTSIAQENVSLVEQAKSFFEIPMGGIFECLTKISEEYIPTLENILYTLNYEAKDCHDKIKDSKDLVVPQKGKFVRCTTVSLSELDFSELPDSNIDKIKLNKAIKNIAELDFQILNYLMSNDLESKDIEDILSNGIDGIPEKYITLERLISFFAHDKIENLFEILKTNITRLKDQAEFFKNSSGINKSDYGLTSQFIINEGENIRKCIRESLNYASMCVYLSQLNASALFIFSELKKF